MPGAPELIFAAAGLGLTFILTLLLCDKMLAMIAGSGFTRPNFKGTDIPLSAGVIFFISALPVSFLLLLAVPAAIGDRLQLYLLAMAAATCLGLIDDFWGARDTLGLLGHFRALLAGRLTTGALKALGGGALGLFLAARLFPGQLWKIADSTLMIALSINLLNLFDLRPGRAGKIFVLLCLGLLPFAFGRPEMTPVALALGSLLAFFPVDLKAGAMMGDAGSNTLGVVIGITAAATLDGYYRIAYLALLLLVHALTEKYSLTRIIAGNQVLNFLDLLGREKEPHRR